MTTPSRTAHCIIAGFDGSPASRAAVSLAVQRARPDGRVVVVHAFSPPDGAYGGPSYQKLFDAALSNARGRLANIADEVPGLGSLDWGTEVLAGPPAIALTNVADVEHATEIVVGTRGFGRGRALLGSVAHDLIHLARCPVTVIPQRALDGVPDGPLAATASQAA